MWPSESSYLDINIHFTCNKRSIILLSMTHTDQILLCILILPPDFLWRVQY